MEAHRPDGGGSPARSFAVVDGADAGATPTCPSPIPAQSFSPTPPLEFTTPAELHSGPSQPLRTENWNDAPATTRCDSQFADPHEELQFGARTAVLSRPLSVAAMSLVASVCAALEASGVLHGHAPFDGPSHARVALKAVACAVLAVGAALCAGVALVGRDIADRVPLPVMPGTKIPGRTRTLAALGSWYAGGAALAWPLGVSVAAVGMDFFGECCGAVYGRDNASCHRSIPALSVFAVIVPVVLSRVRTRFVLPGLGVMWAACVCAAVADAMRNAEKPSPALLVAIAMAPTTVFATAIGMQIVHDSLYRQHYTNERRCVGAEIEAENSRALATRMASIALPEHIHHAALHLRSPPRLRDAVASAHGVCAVGLFEIHSFGSWSQRLMPLEAVLVLQSLWWAFDNGCNSHRVTKVAASGDRYSVTAGLCDAVVDDEEAVAAFGRWQRRVAHQSVEHTLVGLLSPHEVGGPAADRYFGAINALRVRVGHAKGDAALTLVGDTQMRVRISGTALEVAMAALRDCPPWTAANNDNGLFQGRAASLASIASPQPPDGALSDVGAPVDAAAEQRVRNPLATPLGSALSEPRLVSGASSGTRATPFLLPTRQPVTPQLLPPGLSLNGDDVASMESTIKEDQSGAAAAAVPSQTDGDTEEASAPSNQPEDDDDEPRAAVPKFFDMRSREDCGFGAFAMAPLACHYAFLAIGVIAEGHGDDTLWEVGHITTLAVLFLALAVTFLRAYRAATQQPLPGLLDLSIAGAVAAATITCCLFPEGFYSVSASHVALAQLLIIPGNLKRLHPLVCSGVMVVCISVPLAAVVCARAENLASPATLALLGRDALASFFMIRAIFFKTHIDRLRYDALVGRSNAVLHAARDAAALDMLANACVPRELNSVFVSQLRKELLANGDALSPIPMSPIARGATASQGIAARVHRRLAAIGLGQDQLYSLRCACVCAMDITSVTLAPQSDAVVRVIADRAENTQHAGGVELVSVMGDRCVLAGPFRSQDRIRDDENAIASAIACVGVAAHAASAAAATGMAVTAAFACGDVIAGLFGSRCRRFDVVGAARNAAIALLDATPRGVHAAFCTDAFAQLVTLRDLSAALRPDERPNLCGDAAANADASRFFTRCEPWATADGFRGPVRRIRIEDMVFDE